MGHSVDKKNWKNNLLSESKYKGIEIIKKKQIVWLMESVN